MMCIPHSGSLPCMAIMQRAPFSPRTPMRTGAPEVVSPVSSATPPHPSSLVVRGHVPVGRLFLPHSSGHLRSREVKSRDIHPFTLKTEARL